MARSTVIQEPPGDPRPGAGDAFADALQERRVDLEIIYCSGHDRFARLLPTARMTPFPPGLQVGPEYGLAVLKNGDPLAAELALYVRSPKGQAILALYGPALLPLGENRFVMSRPAMKRRLAGEDWNSLRRRLTAMKKKISEVRPEGADAVLADCDGAGRLDSFRGE